MNFLFLVLLVIEISLCCFCCDLKYRYQSVCKFYDLKSCKDKTFESCKPIKRTQKELRCPYWSCPQVKFNEKIEQN